MHCGGMNNFLQDPIVAFLVIVGIVLIEASS
jgi:hypothetical protein